jgi:hypothetical protein
MVVFCCHCCRATEKESGEPPPYARMGQLFSQVLHSCSLISVAIFQMLSARYAPRFTFGLSPSRPSASMSSVPHSLEHHEVIDA